MQFTIKQQEAIDLRNTDILVSAAAGSGKTAVLVERIIKRILDTDNPVDIDRMLVMTFTKAAADQMREKITDAINKKKRENPYDKHLIRQATLVHTAKIGTIHGFCLDVIRDHFSEIDLSPDFRIGDEGECSLLKHDVLEAVLEEAYQNADEDFILMTETIASKKNDNNLESVILKLHEFSMSYPDCTEWLKRCENTYKDLSAEGFEECEWVKAIKSSVSHKIVSALGILKSLYNVADGIDGPYMYKEALANDIYFAERMQGAASFSEMYEIMKTLDFIKMGTAKKSGPFVDPEKKESVLKGRNKCKDEIKKLKENYFTESVEEVVESVSRMAVPVHELIKITRDFSIRYAKAKRDKNIVDFNDLEHFCLEILKKGKETTAKEYRDYFEEIYVDEYQDSNLVQETIVKLISGGSTNVFMVGDVKQSIYRFRLARPDLFIEKYNSFFNGEDGVRIDLSDNFRSRTEVIDTVNEIFKTIMVKEKAGIEYDEAASLHCGADYPDYPEKASEYGVSEGCSTVGVNENNAKNADETEWVNDSEPDLDDKITHATHENQENNQSEMILIKTSDEIDSKELEAHMVADRIKSLVKNHLVWDGKNNTYRHTQFSDIVILLRSNKGWDTIFEKVLTTEGIPAHVSSSTGYFDAIEVQTLLNYLTIIDNPFQDIPLMSVLKSPIGNFSDEEISIVRSKNKDCLLYDALLKYRDMNVANESLIKQTPNDLIIELKLEEFLDRLDEFRSMSSYTSVYDILVKIIDGEYGEQIVTMNRGKNRLANLNMLVKKAEDYGKTSYKGLFHFIRYIELIKKYEVDYGEANLLDENDNIVRIMSIHKSKGLEFPICFVCGMHKKINNRDAYDTLALDVDFGIGIDMVDPIKRTKQNTLLKKAVSMKIVSETLAEEMRVLYVALTRAEEKLIMTGVTKDPDSLLDEDPTLMNISSFLDMYMYANNTTKLSSVELRVPQITELIDKKIEDITVKEALREEISRVLEKPENAEKTRLPEEVETRINYIYPHFDTDEQLTKISVSELKKKSMDEKTLENKDTPAEIDDSSSGTNETLPIVPRFIREASSEISPTLHGTALHRMLELWDYGLDGDIDTVKEFFTITLKSKRIEQELYDAVRPEELVRFLSTDLACRMKKACREGKLKREQQFSISMEGYMVQGIIDAYFEEDGQIVIVDYKTDNVRNINDLKEKYHIQLDYYEKALTRLLSMPVSSKIIYSSKFNKTIEV